MQRQSDAQFRKSVVTKLATGAPQKSMEWVRKPASRRRAACRGDRDQPELRRSRSEVSSYARRTRGYARRARFSRCKHFHPANRCDNCLLAQISRAGAVSALSRQVAVIMSSGRRPGRSDVLLRRAPADNGPDGWRPEERSMHWCGGFVAGTNRCRQERQRPRTDSRMSRNDRLYQASATMRGDADWRQQCSPAVIEASSETDRPSRRLRARDVLQLKWIRRPVGVRCGRACFRGRREILPLSGEATTPATAADARRRSG